MLFKNHLVGLQERIADLRNGSIEGKCHYINSNMKKDFMIKNHNLMVYLFIHTSLSSKLLLGDYSVHFWNLKA